MKSDKKIKPHKLKKELLPFIPESHKELVRERRKNSKPEDYISWEIIKKQFKI